MLRKLLVLIIALPLLIAAKPQPSMTVEVTALVPVTITVTSVDLAGVPGTWESAARVTLECSNGYKEESAAAGPDVGDTFVFDATVPNISPMPPEGDCDFYMYIYWFNQSRTQYRYADAGEIEFEVP